jgi:hypothetical protein
VYATTISTPLFFAQAVGRFVRSRRRGETASVFLPTVPDLLTFANEMEVERDHALDKPKKEGEEDPYAESEKEMEEANKEQDEDTGEQEQFSFEALESEAVFDRVLYDGAEFGMQAHPGSEEEQDYLGIPGLLEPDQVQMLLQKRQARTAARSPTTRRISSNSRPSGGPWSPTRRCSNCASSSTPWSARTSTRAASRTA